MNLKKYETVFWILFVITFINPFNKLVRILLSGNLESQEYPSSDALFFPLVFLIFAIVATKANGGFFRSREIKKTEMPVTKTKDEFTKSVTMPSKWERVLKVSFWSFVSIVGLFAVLGTLNFFFDLWGFG